MFKKKTINRNIKVAYPILNWTPNIFEKIPKNITKQRKTFSKPFKLTGLFFLKKITMRTNIDINCKNNNL